jgi:hypothetical protein
MKGVIIFVLVQFCAHSQYKKCEGKKENLKKDIIIRFTY